MRQTLRVTWLPSNREDEEVNVEEAQEIIDFAETAERTIFPQRSAEVWAEILSTMPVEEARVAVVGHYENSTDRLMPAHLTRRQEAWKPDRSDFKPTMKKSDEGGFTDLFDQMFAQPDPIESARIRESKFKAEAERLGVDPSSVLKKP